MLLSRPYRLLFAVLLLACATGLLAAPAAPRTDTVMLVHTNDIHDNLRPLGGRYGGLVYVSGYVHRLRQQRPDVVLLDAGDVCEKGDMLGVVSQGLYTYRAVAAVGYDAGAPGNHEGAYGAAQWQANVEASHFPIVACNICYEDNGETVFPATREVTADGVRVGIIGVGNTIRGTVGGRNVMTLGAEAVAARVRDLARELASRNHLVVAVCHQGSKECRRLAAAAPDVDVFVSGHSHEVLAQPIETRPGGALIVQTGDYAKRVGELELTVDLEAAKVVGYRGRLVRMDHATTPVDLALADKLERWNQAVCPEALETLAKAPLTLLASRPSGRPSPLCRWMAEAMRSNARADLAAFTNSMLRHPLAAGPVSADDLYKTSVNRDRRVVCEATLTGVELRAAIEALLARTDAKGLYFAGMDIRSDLRRPAGQRLVAADLDPARRYRLVVPLMLCQTTARKPSLGVAMTELPYTTYEAAVAVARATGTVRLPRRTSAAAVGAGGG